MNDVFKQIEPKDNAPKSSKSEVVGTVEMFLLFSSILELFTATYAKSASKMLQYEPILEVDDLLTDTNIAMNGDDFHF